MSNDDILIHELRRLAKPDRRFELTKAALTGLCERAGLPSSPEHRTANDVAEDIATWAVKIADATLEILTSEPVQKDSVPAPADRLCFSKPSRDDLAGLWRCVCGYTAPHGMQTSPHERLR